MKKPSDAFVLASFASAILLLGSCSGGVAPDQTRSVSASSTRSLEWMTGGKLSPEVSGIGSIACTSSMTCVVAASDEEAGHGALFVTSDGGGTWAPTSQLPTGQYVTGAVCNESGTCLALEASPDSDDSQVLRSGNGGKSWAEAYTAKNTFLKSIACGPDGRCVTVGAHRDAARAANSPPGALIASSDDGMTWKEVALPGDVGPLTDAVCASAGRCVAVGAGRTTLHTSDDGTWRLVRPPERAETLDRVSCASPDICIAIGQQEQTQSKTETIVQTTNGGESWAEVPALGGAANAVLSDLSCTAELCLAVGADGSHTLALLSHDHGGSWTLVSGPGDAVGMAAVDCLSQNCIAVGVDVSGAYRSFSLSGSS